MNAPLADLPVPGVRGRWLRNEPMARHSTWRCGGPAQAYFEPADRDDLRLFLRGVPDATALLWLGLGSNLLVRDGGLAAVVIATAPGLATLRWEAEDRVYAECGVTCARLAREAARHDRAGLEFLAGIPGTVGGALRMNAGALGSETWALVEAVETIDARGEVRRHPAADFTPVYRGVSGPAGWFLGAWFRLPTTAGGRGAERIRGALAQRGATQPTGQASCGSVFKNPPGDYAGRLIEQCGLKGFRIGGCQVSTVHANFIVNDERASAADVEAVIEHVATTVAARTGVRLQTEVQIVGETPGAGRP
ncbi:MAG: UDP-N-acetylmuramate dehydrogenase [Gammaproteobacteria bacterium]|nr:UDP-N-acetylmuramate dehydrogenase [Gammaproteobacteria bacterium]